MHRPNKPFKRTRAVRKYILKYKTYVQQPDFHRNPRKTDSTNKKMYILDQTFPAQGARTITIRLKLYLSGRPKVLGGFFCWGYRLQEPKNPYAIYVCYIYPTFSLKCMAKCIGKYSKTRSIWVIFFPTQMEKETHHPNYHPW